MGALVRACTESKMKKCADPEVRLLGTLRASTLTRGKDKPSPGLGSDLSLCHGINTLLNLSHLIFLVFKKELTLLVLPNHTVYLLHQPGETRGEKKCPDVLASKWGTWAMQTHPRVSLLTSPLLPFHIKMIHSGELP